MKAKLGVFFTVVGLLLLAGAAGLYSQNLREATNAERAVELLVPEIAEKISKNAKETNRYYEDASTEFIDTIDGNSYIGVICFPSEGLELPVMADWDESKLKIAPCRFSGSISEDNIVIMAHNYRKHFGKISNLKVGDAVKFIGMNGKTVEYKVTATDILSQFDTKDMTDSGYDLTLFTCDYSGKNRITVRCDRL